MTGINVSMIDVYVLRGAGPKIECLTLRRAPGRARAGAWETVHGHIEDGERPHGAALRELREETGLAAGRLYNVSRVELFYLHRRDEVAVIPVFAAFVDPQEEVTLSEEHDAAEWLPPAIARQRFLWPRERRALDDVLALLGSGDAGPAEDVLRVC